jgi:GH25 family lysozyme M1 (1,4-beta-N-acetylmuramidase)
MNHRHSAFALALLSISFAACAPGGSDNAAGDSGEGVDDGSDAIKQCAKGPTVKGVDVSYYQGKINWTKVKASGVDFAITRTSDGSTFKDPRFEENWAGIKAAGMVRGVYQFFRPGQSATAQADLMISMLDKVGGLKDGDLAPTLDVEVTDGVAGATLISRMKTWLSKVEAATGRTPMVYTAPGWWSQFGAPGGLGKYTLWVANWGVSCPSVANSWDHWTFWQNAYNGSVPGIAGNVDTDRFDGSLADLLKFAGGKPAGGGGGGGVDNSSGMASLGGNTKSEPAIGKNADGRLEVFSVSSGGDLVTTFQTEPNGGWSGWFNLGGNLAGNPTVGKNEDGRLEIFARGTDHAIWHAWQAGANGKIGSFVSVGGDVNADPVVASNEDGRLELFVPGGDGFLYHMWQIKPNGGWSSFAVLGAKVGGGLEDARVVKLSDGRLAVVAKGIADDAIWLSEQTAPNGGRKAWKSLGGKLSSAPALAKNQDGRLEVFARGTDGALWHTWETAPGAAWSAWSSLGGIVYDPTAASDKDGRLEVFVRGSDGKLYKNRQTAPNAGWEDWTGMGAKMEGGAGVGRNADGRLEVFVQAPDGSVRHAWQSAPGTW